MILEEKKYFRCHNCLGEGMLNWKVDLANNKAKACCPRCGTVVEENYFLDIAE